MAYVKPTLSVCPHEGVLTNLDWNSLTAGGANSNIVVLVDHHAIEVRYSRQLEMMTRFDL